MMEKGTDNAAKTPFDVLMNSDGEWTVDWFSNTVMIIGPTADIDAFKELCIAPAAQGAAQEDRFKLERIVPTPANLRDYENRWWRWRNAFWGTGGEAWGLKIDPSSDAWTLSFSFFTEWIFPKPVFRHLAKRFPRLAFYCFSLECGCQYMTCGWFNTPAGCSAFGAVEDVPDDHPFSGRSCDPIAELRHMGTLQQLKEIAQRSESV